MMRTKSILFCAIAFLSFFLILYIIIFHHGLSSNHEEWGSFGDYIGGIGGIVLSCSIFYYTYIIDKDHKKTEKNTQVLKLLDIVGESLLFFNSWEEFNVKLDDPSTFNGTHGQYVQMKEERNKLEIQLWVNYKTTQVLANHLYGMDIPDVDKLYETKNHFRKVFNQIKN